MAESSSDPPRWWDRFPWIGLRRAVAAALVLGLTAIVILSYLPNAVIASCRHEVTNEGTVVALCAPIGAADIVAVGLVLLIAAVFISPELSEVGVSGLITLKRRVDEAQREQRTTGDTVRSLTLAQEVPDLGATRRELSEQLARWSELQDNVHVVPNGTSRPSTAPRDARVISEQRADLEERLLRLANETDEYFRVLSHEDPLRMLRHPSRYRKIRDVDLEAYLAGLRLWSMAYEDLLRKWAVVRNLAVHYPEKLSDDEVRDAVALGEGLLTALEGYLPQGAPRYGAR